MKLSASCHVIKRDNSNATPDWNIENSVFFCNFYKSYQGKVPFSFLCFDNYITRILYLLFEKKICSRKNITTLYEFLPIRVYEETPCFVEAGSWKISKCLLVAISKVTMNLNNSQL